MSSQMSAAFLRWPSSGGRATLSATGFFSPVKSLDVGGRLRRSRRAASDEQVREESGQEAHRARSVAGCRADTLTAACPTRSSVPRGRHAPPLEVRQDRQRRRLNEAAAAVFARVGYADATAEAIAREAGHVEGDVLRALRQQGGLHPRAVRRRHGAADRRDDGRRRGTGGDKLDARRSATAVRSRALLEVDRRAPRLRADPAGRDHRRRPAARWSAATPCCCLRAATSTTRNAQDAEAGRRRRACASLRRLASRSSAAIFELAVAPRSATSRPEDIRDLVPVVERLIAGMLAAGERAGRRVTADGGGARGARRPLLGLAHVASCSFLACAARAVAAVLGGARRRRRARPGRRATHGLRAGLRRERGGDRPDRRADRAGARQRRR